MTLTDQERREMIANMPPEVKARAVELYDSIVQATKDTNQYSAMTNAQLADALVNGPWADLPMFSKWSNLLDVVIDRLRATE